MRNRFSDRVERLLQEARARVVIPEEEKPWAAAERADPALLADRLGLPLTEGGARATAPSAGPG